MSRNAVVSTRLAGRRVTPGELLAVLVILAVMAALLFPVFARVDNRPEGVVRDGAGRPISHAVLRFRDSQGHVVATLTADEHGQFRRSHLGDLCRNAIDGFAETYYHHSTGGTDHYEFSPLGAQEATFRNFQGKPVFGLVVSFRPDQQTWAVDSTTHIFNLVSDKNGKARVANIPIIARLDIQSRDKRYVVQSVQTSVEGQVICYQVTVAAPATITGKLLSQWGPVGGCYPFVTTGPDLEHNDRRYAGVTGKYGRFRITALPAGTYYVSVKPPGDFHAIAPAQCVTVASGQTADVLLREME